MNRLVLGIETSCDETAAAVIRDGREVLSNVIASQTDLHQPFGGVVPEIAARRHIECVGLIVNEALRQAGCALSDVDAFAVANGPGLAGALLVGLSYAKALAYAVQKPLVGVHHIEGHVCANYLNGGWQPPFLSLVVSGGHTTLLAVRNYAQYEVLGRTRDDAAGEAFDKAARALGLPYPGGPSIERLAKEGNPDAVRFPRAKVDGLDFSFSGLKTALVQYLARTVEQRAGERHVPMRNISNVNSEGIVSVADIAASFQKAAVDVLVDHTVAACAQTGFTDVALAGGVASNGALREAMRTACSMRGLRLHVPEAVFCTDNAAMIACRGYYALAEGKRDGYDLNAYPSRMVG